MDNLEKSIEIYTSHIKNKRIEKAILLASDIEKKINLDCTLSGELKYEFYISYAMLNFEKRIYTQFFELLMIAQNISGLDKELISEIIEIFVNPNLSEFRQNYTENIKEIKNVIKYHIKRFDDLDEYYIPTEKEDIYYVYNKYRNRLCGKINISKENLLSDIEGYFNKFSDYVILRDVEQIFKKLYKKEKLIYNIKSLSDIDLSFFQLRKFTEKEMEKLIFLENENEFFEYLNINDAYLPYNIIAYTKEKTIVERILKDIHTDRITKVRKNKDNILLSICIPTYNRGEKAFKNISQMLESEFDNEIEFVISNNGSDNETKHYYDKIKNIKDKRVIYSEFETNQGVSINCCKVASMANGKFFVLVSDEDSIKIDKIHEVLEIIKKQGNELAVIKTNFEKQGDCIRGYANKGKEAYLNFSFTANYLTINIFNNTMIKENNILDYTINNQDNQVCYYYPHVAWDFFIMQYGDVYGTSLYITKEGKDDGTFIGYEQDNNESKDVKKIPRYQTIESRISQHTDATRIFDSIQYLVENKDVYKLLFIISLKKTVSLIRLSVYKHGLEYNKEIKNKVEDFVNSEIEKINEKLGDKDTLETDIKNMKSYLKKVDNRYV